MNKLYVSFFLLWVVESYPLSEMSPSSSMVCHIYDTFISFIDLYQKLYNPNGGSGYM